MGKKRHKIGRDEVTEPLCLSRDNRLGLDLRNLPEDTLIGKSAIHNPSDRTNRMKYPPRRATDPLRSGEWIDLKTPIIRDYLDDEKEEKESLTLANRARSEDFRQALPAAANN